MARRLRKPGNFGSLMHGYVNWKGNCWPHNPPTRSRSESTPNSVSYCRWWASRSRRESATAKISTKSTGTLNSMDSKSQMTQARYRDIVTHGLTVTHGCPHDTAAALLADYDDVIQACWSEGVAAVGVIKLLYSEWKVFRNTA